LAIGCIAAATDLAGSVFAPEEADSNSLVYLPSRDAWANLLDAANCFVSWNSRIYDAGKLSFNGTRV
jgi:hypothetical protein